MEYVANLVREIDVPFSGVDQFSSMYGNALFDTLGIFKSHKPSIVEVYEWNANVVTLL